MIRDPHSFAELTSAVRRFTRDRLVPLEAKVSAEDHVPDEVVQEMRELGLFGISVPEEFGGLGCTMEEECSLAFELGGTSPAFRSVIGTNVGIGSQGLVMDGTPEQKAKYLSKIASGEIRTSFALTEPNAGSDAGSVRTFARKDGEHYVINGTKRYITNAPYAGLFTVYARTAEGTTDAKGVSAFLVEGGLPGLSIGKAEKKMGQQGAHVADVIFDNVRVPKSALLGGVEGQGFRTAMKVLDRGRLHISAVAVGMAERVIGMMVSYANERKQFGKPISEFQLIQAKLADSHAETFAAKCMVLDCARRRDIDPNGPDLTRDIAATKYFATEMCGRVVDRAVQVYGGAGYIADYGIERMFRDARLFRIYEGTSEIQQLVIARELIRGAGRS